MRQHMLLLAVASTLGALLIVSVECLLLERPCFVQGNPWKGMGAVSHRARPVAMMGENVGHNPFNTFPGMEQYGNCMEVHFTLMYETINVTIVCGVRHGMSMKQSNPTLNYHAPEPKCPVYTPGIRWPIANLIYLEYDVRRFELSSCVRLNETHSYHGQWLLTDDIETRSYLHPEHLPMWHLKLQQPNTIPFQFEGNCSECNFRNEYIAHVPNIHSNMDLVPPEAEPYCRDGEIATSKPPSSSHITMKLNVATSDLMVKLLIPGVVLFGGVILFRFCLSKKTAEATVAPMGATYAKS